MTLSKLLLGFGLLAGATVHAADPASTDPAVRYAQLQKLAGSLKPESGMITVGGGIAKIALTRDFRYLNPTDTKTVVNKIWGNPGSLDSLGMIMPSDFDPLMRGSWAVIITYTEDGHIDDSDAASLDYNKLLTQMKDGTRTASAERVKQGYPSIELVGWAEPPHYDHATHKLYWAQQIRFGNSNSDTLNYNIRILGRRGVLILNAVAEADELAAVRNASPNLLSMVNFQEGHRYLDFNASTDKVATYGLGALVLGGIAVKAGFFKLLIVGILAAKKFVIVAVLAVSAYFKKAFRRIFPQKTAGSAAPPPAQTPEV